MRLVYFVSPYELLDVAAGRAITLTTDTPHSRELSHYVTVNIEASNSHKLQTTTLMLITKQANGKKYVSLSPRVIVLSLITMLVIFLSS